MRTLSIMLLWCCCFAACGEIEAGGFFRRVPEVGEWARYDMRFKRIEDRRTPEGESFVSREVVGNLILKCVGETNIDQHRCLWLEASFEGSDEEGESGSLIVKVLVPADQIVGADLADHVVQGWIRELDSDVESIQLDHDEFSRGETWFAMLLAFSSSAETAGRRHLRTLTIDGVEVELSHCESGSFAEHEFLDAHLSGEATWWPSDDYAFGVAAVELTWREVRIPSERATEMKFWLELVATGTDAVSDLPDHN